MTFLFLSVALDHHLWTLSYDVPWLSQTILQLCIPALGSSLGSASLSTAYTHYVIFILYPYTCLLDLCLTQYCIISLTFTHDTILKHFRCLSLVKKETRETTMSWGWRLIHSIQELGGQRSVSKALTLLSELSSKYNLFHILCCGALTQIFNFTPYRFLIRSMITTLFQRTRTFNRLSQSHPFLSHFLPVFFAFWIIRLHIQTLAYDRICLLFILSWSFLEKDGVLKLLKSTKVWFLQVAHEWLRKLVHTAVLSGHVHVFISVYAL